MGVASLGVGALDVRVMGDASRLVVGVASLCLAGETTLVMGGASVVSSR